MTRVRAALPLVVAAVLALALACGNAESDPLVSSTQSPGNARLHVTSTAVTRELWVAPNGNDAADGSRGTPFQTVRKAGEAATPGTVVHVADGTYAGKIVTKASGSATARIVYSADTPQGAKIVSGDNDNGAAWVNQGDFVDIQGFDVTGTGTDGLTQAGSNGRLVGNRVHGFTEGNCITVAEAGYQLHDNDVIGNTAFGCGAGDLDHGIYVGDPGGTVADNISYGNSGDGIECWHNCNRLTISNNLVFDNGDTGIVVGQGDDPNFGRIQADGFTVANNLVYGNKQGSIAENGSTGPANRYLNNLLFDNGKNNAISLQTGTEMGTVTSDPRFVNYKADGSGDYHLRQGSPAIDTGTSMGAYPEDFDGVSRPQGGGYDIGIYEQ